MIYGAQQAFWSLEFLSLGRLKRKCIQKVCEVGLNVNKLQFFGEKAYHGANVLLPAAYDLDYNDYIPRSKL